jgi:hypothetical protein
VTISSIITAAKILPIGIFNMKLKPEAIMGGLLFPFELSVAEYYLVAPGICQWPVFTPRLKL